MAHFQVIVIVMLSIIISIQLINSAVIGMIKDTQERDNSYLFDRLYSIRAETAYMERIIQKAELIGVRDDVNEIKCILVERNTNDTQIDPFSKCNL